MTAWAKSFNSERRNKVKELFMEIQNNRCFYCDEIMEIDHVNTNKNPKNMTLDHIHPQSLGGHVTLFKNLVACCVKCNVKKGNKVFTCTVEQANTLEKIHTFVENSFFEYLAPGVIERRITFNFKQYRFSPNFSWEFIHKKAQIMKPNKIVEKHDGYYFYWD